MRVQVSPLEEEIKSINELKLNTEKKRMLDEINREIEDFDKKILLCSNEKNIMESDMTIATMKVVTYYQELIILIDMEDYDNKLIQDLVNCRNQKKELEDQSNSIVANLNGLASKDAANDKELTEQM
jgi:cilia- and flagella-associated protein 44